MILTVQELEKMSTEDLHDANRKIVELIRYRRKLSQATAATTLRIGMQVYTKETVRPLRYAGHDGVITGVRGTKFVVQLDGFAHHGSVRFPADCLVPRWGTHSSAVRPPLPD
jgi:hypothetical protein